MEKILLLRLLRIHIARHHSYFLWKKEGTGRRNQQNGLIFHCIPSIQSEESTSRERAEEEEANRDRFFAGMDNHWERSCDLSLPFILLNASAICCTLSSFCSILRMRILFLLFPIIIVVVVLISDESGGGGHYGATGVRL